ncbi:MAG: hypothetical protein P4L71_08505 [Acetobacteraceae bacterium]|nr:hypothetical protein [Acetobacteraceae bacterium]
MVRYPRLQVLADGEPLNGAFEARVVSNNYYMPDRFSLRLLRGSLTNGLPDYLQLPEATAFSISAGVDSGASFTCLIVGRGDSLSCDYVSRGIRIDGRDLSAVLQDTPTNDVFSNRTSSEIATILAERHGLIPVVMPTATLAGRYYHGDTNQGAHNQFSRTSTEWDLLVFLARCECFDIFVVGSALYFQPIAQGLGVSTVLRPSDLITLKLRRRLRLSGDIAVTVRSWSSKQSIAITQTVVSQRLGYASVAGSLGASPTQHYYLVQPNLSASDAERIAQNRVEELARHEQCIDFTMPGEQTLTARSRFFLQGTDSDFDQIYQVDSIERTISSSSGFVQRVSAHSISTRQTILSPF